MKQTKADAIADAVLEPYVRAQDAKTAEIHARHAAEKLHQTRKRRAAWFVLAASGTGIVIAHFAGVRWPDGMLLGGAAGIAIGLVVTRAAKPPIA